MREDTVTHYESTWIDSSELKSVIPRAADHRNVLDSRDQRDHRQDCESADTRAPGALDDPCRTSARDVLEAGELNWVDESLPTRVWVSANSPRDVRSRGAAESLSTRR